MEGGVILKALLTWERSTRTYGGLGKKQNTLRIQKEKKTSFLGLCPHVFVLLPASTLHVHTACSAGTWLQHKELIPLQEGCLQTPLLVPLCMRRAQ